MTLSTISLQIVIPYYNGEEFIRPLLRSIDNSKALGKFKVKVIIVDNSDSRSVLSIAREGFSFEIDLIRTKNSNIGYARACNVGIEYCLRSDYDYIMFLNQDTLFQSNCLVKLVTEAWKSIDQNNIFSPKIYGDTGFHQPLDYVGSSDYSDLERATMAQEIDFIQGGCYLMSRKTLKLLEFFDPIFILYGEDMDMVRRLRTKGGKLVMVQHAKLYHRVSYLDIGRKEKATRSALLNIAKVINGCRHDNKSLLFSIYYFIQDLIRALGSQSLGVLHQVCQYYFKFISSIFSINKYRSSDIRKRAVHYLLIDINQDKFKISTSQTSDI